MSPVFPDNGQEKGEGGHQGPASPSVLAKEALQEQWYFFNGISGQRVQVTRCPLPAREQLERSLLCYSGVKAQSRRADK